MHRAAVGRLGSTRRTAGVLAVLAACGQPTTQEDFDCEVALAYLVRCCAGFPVDQAYCPEDLGFGDDPGLPNFTLSSRDSRCIQAKSCTELASDGVCSRVTLAIAKANANGNPPSNPDASFGPLCP